MTDAWLDGARGEWLTGPEVAEANGLQGRVVSLGVEKMNDGEERRTVVVHIEGRDRKFAVNVGAAEKIAGFLRGKASSSLIGKTIEFTTEIAKNPRTQVSGPAVRIARIR